MVCLYFFNLPLLGLGIGFACFVATRLFTFSFLSL